MGINDGTVITPVVPLLEPLPATEQCNIVLVAEGFTGAEQDDFNDRCAEFVEVLQAEPWFAVAGGAINVYRLNVESDESGTDDPAECGGDDTTVDTYFDAGFCNGSPPIRRCISGDENLVRDELDAALPQWHVAAVLVNTDRGGCRFGNVFWTNVGSNWQGTVIHELGHAGFGLADEYDYWSDCSDENPRTSAEEPNVTRATTLGSLKWRHLRTPGVPIPTMSNTDCAQCDTTPNVLSDDLAIGLFEGARYEHCSMFRPAYTCKMRRSADPFCRVCVEAIVTDLGGFADAAPVLEVVQQSLDFGEVANGLTMYLPLEVRNVRSGHPMPMEVTLSAPTGGFFFPTGTEPAFTLPAPVFEGFTSRAVFVAFTAAGNAPATGEIVVSAEGQSVVVDLAAVSVPPVPVDSVLVIDRSGSMSEPTTVAGQRKIDYAIEAGALYVSLLKESDQIGVVRYNQGSGPADVLLAMRVAGALGSGAGRLAANGVLTPTNLTPSGATSIGAGIINGSGVLAGGSADARALVVLTDGLQNTAPDVAAGQVVVQAAAPAQRVFAVGLGLNQLEVTLDEIATVTNGVAQITGDLVDDREFLLQKLYVQILSDASGEAFVRDPVSILRPGQKRATPVFLSEIDVACDFIVIWRPSQIYPKYLRIWLEAPDGTLIESSVSSPAVEHVLQDRHMFFRVRFPFEPAAPLGHVGMWRVWVEAFQRPGEFTETLHYSVMAKARSNVLLSGRVVQDDYRPGSAMRIELEPSLFGQPVRLDEPVRVEVTRPDGVRRTVDLAADIFGVYRGTFADTAVVGPYALDADVGATSPAGNRVTRSRHMTGLIFRARPGGGGPGGGGPGGLDPEECKQALAALETLVEALRRCCRSLRTHPD
jgi:hypothetical protein